MDSNKRRVNKGAGGKEIVEDDDGDFAGIICPICYDALKPFTQNLQSITICGHVFHNLCLQKWFLYTSKAKKHTCPLCKQSCKASDVRRLYFTTIGEVMDAATLNFQERTGVLARKVMKLLDAVLLLLVLVILLLSVLLFSYLTNGI